MADRRGRLCQWCILAPHLPDDSAATAAQELDVSSPVVPSIDDAPQGNSANGTANVNGRIDPTQPDQRIDLVYPMLRRVAAGANDAPTFDAMTSDVA